MKSHSNGDVLRCSSAGVSGGRVSKHHNPNYRDAVSEEMQMYFSKLKELVPFMPKNKKLSKLEIIQYVIDYICDLQLALETQPRSPNASTPPNSTVAAANASPAVSPTRQPLGVIAAPNTLPNTCAAQEATHLDKVPSHLELDLGTRPVSC